jgi:transcriptional regulator with XRE-family HTH domain
MEDLRKIIGKNLTELRKRRNLTQLELAEKFNYTDRAISKWENGDTLPDVEVLYNLCEFYGVTIDYLTHEDNSQFKKKGAPLAKSNKIAITSLVSSFLWMVATFIFVYSILKHKNPLWQAYIWAVPANALVLVYFNHIYFHRKLLSFISFSLIIWGVITAFYLSYGDPELWPLFLLGIPTQASLVLWLNIRQSLKKKQN